MVLVRLLSLLVPPCCLACTAPVAAGQGLCPACRRGLAWLPAREGEVFSPVAYEGPARALVHALKFGGRPAAAAVMAAQIAANAPPGLLCGTLVPVPAHPRRRRQRGFDQAHVLARELARRTGLPVDAALSRAGTGTEQVGSGRRQRLTKDLGIGARWAVDGPVVLIDDVVTTGATLRTCAQVLGAERTCAVVYARTIGDLPLRFP